MYRVLTASESRDVEARALGTPGTTVDDLMRAAGKALADAVTDRAPEGEVRVVCGPGNNGGDGWVCAHLLHEAGRRVRVVALRDPADVNGVAERAARAAVDSGVHWEPAHGVHAEDALAGAAVVVDALLGTGSKLPLREPFGTWCSAISGSEAYVIAADLPTGVDADTGQADERAVVADCTVTFISPKRGLLLFPGAGVAGEVVVADLGVPQSLVAAPGSPEVLTASEYLRMLPRPAPDAHKNSRGRVLVVAGSGRFPGAAVLAARGASRFGAGYVTVAVPEPVVPVVQSHIVSCPVVGLPSGRSKALSSSAAHAVLDLSREYDAVVIGPGLSLADGAVACVRAVVPRISRPLVIDADALNALVDATGLLDERRMPTVLTPHPGELARLMGVAAADVQLDRISSCARMARVDRAVVLKGAGTITSDGSRHVMNTSGSVALATAGTGDVLAGMVGALLAQGVRPLEAGALAAYVHGRAGEIASRGLTPWGVTAEDVPGRVPEALGELLEDW